MTAPERQDAELLQTYWTALADDPATLPPPGLDPELAALARSLTCDVSIPAPSPAFVDALQRRLTAQVGAPGAQNGSAHVQKRGWPPRRWWPVAALATTVVLVLALLGTALGVYLWSSPPKPVSAQAIVRRSIAATLAPSGGVRLTQTITRYPGNSGLPLFAGYTGTVRSVVTRWYQTPRRWRIERRSIAPPRGFLAQEYDAPGMQVSDGHVIWDYDARSNTISIAALAGQSGTADLFPLGESDAAPPPGTTPTSLTGVLQEVTRCYTPTLQGSAHVAGRDTYVLNLERHGCYSTSAHEIDGRLKLWVDKATFFVLKSILYDVGDRTKPYVVTAVTAIQYHARIDASVFTYTPPLGATVVDTRSPAPTLEPIMERYGPELTRLAARADFPLFVPSTAFAGLALRPPQLDARGELRLTYAPPTATGATLARDAIFITERAATPADSALIPPGAQPVQIGTPDSPETLSGWADRSGTSVRVVRNGAYVRITSRLLAHAGLIAAAGSLVPVPGGHALLSNPVPRGLAAIRRRVPFAVFVPTHVPRGYIPQQPVLGATGSLVTIAYTGPDSTLSVGNGPAGCCLDQDARKGQDGIRLPNGVTAHFIPNEPQFGGPILWLDEDGSYVAISGPTLTRGEEIKIAASLSKTADLPNHWC